MQQTSEKSKWKLPKNIMIFYLCFWHLKVILGGKICLSNFLWQPKNHSNLLKKCLWHLPRIFLHVVLIKTELKRKRTEGDNGHFTMRWNIRVNKHCCAFSSRSKLDIFIISVWLVQQSPHLHVYVVCSVSSYMKYMQVHAGYSEHEDLFQEDLMPGDDGGKAHLLHNNIVIGAIA